MASNSITILPGTSHKTTLSGAVVSFNGGLNQFTSSDTGDVNFSSLTEGDIITVTGSVDNNDTFTVVSSTPGAVVVLEDVITEAEGPSITVDYVGVYSTKHKADGYYGFTDGLHTVAYHLNAFEGTISMQATLVSDPESTDWFDITGTAFTYGVAETSSTGYNFSGNFVWVRAALTNFTAGTVDKIFYNF
jgi:hypothetical protein